MTAGEISGWPRHFLTIWLIEYWNWSWREFLVWPFSGKKFFFDEPTISSHGHSHSWRQKGELHFSGLQGPKRQELGFLSQFPSLRDLLSDHLIYSSTNKYHKSTWSTRAHQAAKPRINLPTATSCMLQGFICNRTCNAKHPKTKSL